MIKGFYKAIFSVGGFIVIYILIGVLRTKTPLHEATHDLPQYIASVIEWPLNLIRLHVKIVE